MITKGEWSCDYGDYSIFCDTGAEIAQVVRGAHDDGGVIPDDEMEGNLNLLAAAPELLAALKLAAAAIRDNDLDESMAGEFEIITDAIAKAEGKRMLLPPENR